MWFWMNIIYSIVAPIGVLFVPKLLVTNALQKGLEGQVTPANWIANLVPWLNSYRIKKMVEGHSRL